MLTFESLYHQFKQLQNYIKWQKWPKSKNSSCHAYPHPPDWQAPLIFAVPPCIFPPLVCCRHLANCSSSATPDCESALGRSLRCPSTVNTSSPHTATLPFTKLGNKLSVKASKKFRIKVKCYHLKPREVTDNVLLKKKKHLSSAPQSPSLPARCRTTFRLRAFLKILWSLEVLKFSKGTRGTDNGMPGPSLWQLQLPGTTDAPFWASFSSLRDYSYLANPPDH